MTQSLVIKLHFFTPYLLLTAHCTSILFTPFCCFFLFFLNFYKGLLDIVNYKCSHVGSHETSPPTNPISQLMASLPCISISIIMWLNMWLIVNSSIIYVPFGILCIFVTTSNWGTCGGVGAISKRFNSYLLVVQISKVAERHFLFFIFSIQMKLCSSFYVLGHLIGQNGGVL